MLALFPRWTVDDAFIVFRYARNLALHGELNWNVGMDPVEGYTGVLYPLLLAVPIGLGLSPVGVSQVLGVAAFLGTGALVFAFLRRLRVAAGLRHLVLLLFATLPIHYTHAFAGLETMLFSACVIGSLLLAQETLTDLRRAARNESLLLGLLLVTSLVRPEGVVLSAALMAATAAFRSRWQERRSFALRALLVYAIPGALYFAWRWSYYGQLLPNTFYAKSAEGWLTTSTLEDLVVFGAVYLAAPLLACLLLVVADVDRLWARLSGEGRRGAATAAVLAAGGVFAALSTLQYLRSELVMNYSFRFFVPFLPIFLVAAGWVADRALRSLRESRADRPRTWRVATGLAGTAVSLQLVLHVGLMFAPDGEAADIREYELLLEHEHIAAGHYLKEVVPPGEWLIVYGAAGAMPFYSELPTVDFGALNDETLARRRLSPPELADYFYSYDAAAVVFTNRGWPALEIHERGRAIVEDPRFGRYVLARRFRAPIARPYYQFLYLRRDLLPRR